MNKKLLALVAVAAVIVIYLWPQPAPEPIVRTAIPEALRHTITGPVIGFADEQDTLGWLGIPFAAAPVDELRWAAPRLAEPWQEPLQATEFGSACVQLWGPLAGVPGETGQVVGSEDCLYLNVWAPRVRSNLETGGLPVMVWIHGGGNTIGTANTYPSAYLAGSENVVMVTINYRLGLLGWLSHPALRLEGRSGRDASGNYGNLDMIAALEWVQNNIAIFGGDPDNVTIFGESAGGRNVFSLMASPLGKDLFHKAIAQSGSMATTPQWRAENFSTDDKPGVTLSSREWLATQLQLAGRAEDRAAARAAQALLSDEEVYQFIQSRSIEEIMHGLSGGAGMFSTPQSFRDGTVLPVTDLYTLFEDPANYNSVPLITGTNKNEAKLFMAQNPDYVERKYGFLPRIKDLQRYNRDAALISDLWRARAVDEAAAVITAQSPYPVFAYRWDWDEGGQSWLVNYAELLGAGHGLEVAFVFNSFRAGGITAPGLYTDDNIPGRDILAQQMRSYWAEFARSGTPGRGGNGELLEWRAWTPTGANLMLLDTAAGGGLRMVDQPMTAAMLQQRVVNDDSITELETRCAVYAELFLKANAGDRFWNENEYLELGCEQFNPWQLESVR